MKRVGIFICLLLISGCATGPSWESVEAGYKAELKMLDQQYRSGLIDAEEYKMKYQLVYSEMSEARTKAHEEGKSPIKKFFEAGAEATKSSQHVDVTVHEY